jgi:hypothetical protein
MSGVKSDLNDEGGLVRTLLNSKARLISRTAKNNNSSIASLAFGIHRSP